ncbi:MAG: alpha/beta hydrolase [Bacilli bacterium]|nr:alpha/beta hydrolase [Bacilli bacterium]
MEWYIYLIIIGCSLLLIYVTLVILSHLIYHRSLMASIVEIYLKITAKKLTDEEVIQGIKDLPSKNDQGYEIPKNIKFSVDVKKVNYQNMEVIYLNEKSTDKKAIIYLHGAGYVRQPRHQHISFVNKLAKKTNKTVIFPFYPKAPNHYFEESYNLLTSLYLDVLKKYDEVIVMGDSSGGGLALGLCEYFIEKKIKQPESLFLFSPWVNIKLDNNLIPKYEKKDPFISSSNERIWGKLWARDTNLDNYKVSPIYGNMIGLNKVYLYAGTREILYPDCKLLYEILKDSKVDAHFFIGKGLNHVYPIYPIKEARDTLNNIVKIINS